jgi:hypothetical protein
MKLLFTTLTVAALGAGFFLFFAPRVVMILPQGAEAITESQATSSVPETSITRSTSTAGTKNSDIERQKQLANPPSVVRALYITGWSAGSITRMEFFKKLIKEKGMNAIVIDIKDYSGFVSYATGIPEVVSAGAEQELRIARPNALIKDLHDAGIYVIGRVTVFQDPILAKAHPEWAIKDKRTGKLWVDNHKLPWMDPASKPVWDYAVAIGKDAVARGFDEVNYDYIRFPSDGALEYMEYPFWDRQGTKHAQIAEFFEYLRAELAGITISADVFGLTAVAMDDLGIGQKIEDAYASFDYVAPMIYPSHFGKGFIGYQNPAQYPYEVVAYAMENAVQKLATYNKQPTTGTSTSTASSSEPIMKRAISHAKLRPWLQVFDLGATYDRATIAAQIKATETVLTKSTSTDSFGGWMLWDPSNRYSRL